MQELSRDVAVVVGVQRQSVLMLLVAPHVVAQGQNLDHDARRVLPRSDECSGFVKVRGVVTVDACPVLFSPVRALP